VRLIRGGYGHSDGDNKTAKKADRHNRPKCGGHRHRFAPRHDMLFVIANRFAITT